MLVDVLNSGKWFNQFEYSTIRFEIDFLWISRKFYFISIFLHGMERWKLREERRRRFEKDRKETL